MQNLTRFLTRLGILPLLVFLGSCDMVLLDPSGDIALQQRNLIYTAVGLMLLIVVPVIIMTLVIAWKYRASNTEAEYDPDFHHSTKLEFVVWGAPIAIILALGAVTWVATHKLDPYRPLERIDASTPLPDNVRPLTIEVVALDWKWLFFYPEQGIATVNELAAPVNVPIHFKITGTTTMNSFFIPALAGQIYSMPGMQTQLNAVINREGVYKGMSANLSGRGFSHMNFKFHGVSAGGFDEWVAKVKADGDTLDRPRYVELAKPSEKEPVRYFAAADPELYDAILNRCVEENKICMRDIMHIDALGGGGIKGIDKEEALRLGLCTPATPFGSAALSPVSEDTDKNGEKKAI
ncbi:ubiquinol oxidase subunit II [Rhizobiaceae bacterium BDR2-2]|uniref:Ubiquinol oxidase subunit 2 n=1 Tax=Ectorhizobium quercum TaxID=2965071 RepID=A0AAE3MZM7_9HYPH|nr:ubiquinol oxidase subunit II [Ectorhizobium quercum]MCX8998038.1 ubiquinol oxidase subunit II [Ectorhizobium quercum]